MFEVKTSTIPNANKGLFTLQKIKKGQTLGYFSGKILFKNNKKTYNKDYDRHLTRKKRNTDYIISLKNYTVDSLRPLQSPQQQIKQFGKVVLPPKKYQYPGMLAHKMNDALDEKKNNVYFTTSGEVIALRNIKAGEELFMSYGDEYW